jgi:hypothetical protein
MTYPIVCPVCQTVFEANKIGTKYCSRKCSNFVKNEKLKKKRHEHGICDNFEIIKDMEPEAPLKSGARFPGDEINFMRLNGCLTPGTVLRNISKNELEVVRVKAGEFVLEPIGRAG